MKNRALFLMLAATALTASQAMAAGSVFMLQFGSFETREEAEAHLGKVKSQHAGVVGNMQVGVTPVTLPPDNITVYRTQAGPLQTRASAQSACSQLASNGDDCYVVETAMAPSFMPPAATQVASTITTTTTTAPSAPTPAPVTTGSPSQMAALPQPAATTTTTTTTTAAAPMIPPAPAGTSPTAPEASPPVVMAPVPARDPNNVAAINRVTAKPTVTSGSTSPVAMAAAPAPAATADTNVSPSMQRAMEEAAAEQSEREKQIAAAPTPPGAKKEGSFWSRLNPFSDDEEQIAAAPRKPAAPAPATAPVGDVDVVDTSPAMPAPPAPLTAAPATPAAPTPLAPLPQTTPAAPIVMAAPAVAPVPALPQLPPPPAPMQGMGSIAGTSTAASLRAPAPVVAPIPTGSLPNQPIVIADAPGNVRVGEAQRVPLTDTPMPPPPMVMPPMSAPPPAASLRPSATLGQKTLWAHVGQFADAQAALAFWDNYRRTHPDFPVVRVRVASAYAALQRGNEAVSLRVGPFAKQESIQNLCNTVAAAPGSAQLKCGSVVDMGISSAIGGPKNGFLAGSRYQR